MLSSYFIFFFFSSRRRHTRWTGDWSSDVCSSDLTPRRSTWRSDSRPSAAAPRGVDAIGMLPKHCNREQEQTDDRHGRDIGRSEERRVGKECRSRWAPDHEKKKER